MIRRNIVHVRPHTRQHDRKRGFRWTCDLCPRSGGFHAFGRWTDYVLAKHGKQAPHPWVRAMEGANLHWHRYHRHLQPAINIEIHNLTINT